MSFKLIFFLVVVIVIFVILCLRRAGKSLFMVALFAIAILGFVGFIIFVPSSGVSVWVTEHVSPLIEFDTKNTFNDGDKIITFKVLEDSANRDRVTLSAYSDANDLKKFARQFVEERISALIRMRLDSVTDIYTLSFKDSYLIIHPGDRSVSIIKGKLPSDYVTATSAG